MNYKNNKILVAAHRGYSAKYPENTMPAFEAGLALGVDMLEFDIHMTKDRELIILHDSTLDRTTNGTGKPRVYTCKQIRALDAGRHFDCRFQGVQVPLLDEVLALVRGTDVLLNIEIKDKTLEATDAIMRRVMETVTSDRYVINCWDANIVEYVHRKYGVKTHGYPAYHFTNYSNDSYSHCYCVGIHERDTTKAFLDSFRQIGVEPWTYPNDTREGVLHAVDCGTSLMTCNDPVPALTVLRERGLHD